MLKIDNNLLNDLGLGNLPDAEKNSLLKHIYETLEMRVGMRLADQMTNQQLDEFEQYFEAKDDAGAFKWLEANFPNYKDIVQEEFDKLKQEVQQSQPRLCPLLRLRLHRLSRQRLRTSLSHQRLGQIQFNTRHRCHQPIILIRSSNHQLALASNFRWFYNRVKRLNQSSLFCLVESGYQ
jgi:hypothetical protein